jgi:hypothetical protein
VNAHELAPLKQRWTPKRYEARMRKRERRASGVRVDRRAPIHIPFVERQFQPAEGAGFLLGLASLMGLRRRGARAI